MVAVEQRVLDVILGCGGEVARGLGKLVGEKLVKSFELQCLICSTSLIRLNIFLLVFAEVKIFKVFFLIMHIIKGGTVKKFSVN